jgi:hypothetical protein
MWKMQLAIGAFIAALILLALMPKTARWGSYILFGFAVVLVLAFLVVASAFI